MGQKLAYLAIYMANFFMIAIPFSSVGALIPFMAQDLGISQTEYSILFILMSVGCLAAALIYKVLQSHSLLPSHHTVCLICLLGMAIFSLVMLYMKTKIWQCVIFSIFSMMAYILVITTNICLLLAPEKQDVGSWMSYSHGVYGVGALIGPILVGLLAQDMFIVLVVMSVALMPFFYMMASPELQNHHEEVKQNETKKVLKYGSKNLQTFLSLGFFILVGVQVSIQGWIPTYAVLANIQTKQEAVRFTSIFWTLSTIFRFVFGYMSGKDSWKFTSLIKGQLLSGIISTLLAIFTFNASATYVCSIMYGITLSQLFPLLLSVSTQYDLHFTGSQISNMMVSTTISSGVFSTFTGILMKWDINMFFYSVLVISILLYIDARWIMTTLEAQTPLGKTKDIQIPLMDK